MAWGIIQVAWKGPSLRNRTLTILGNALMLFIATTEELIHRITGSRIQVPYAGTTTQALRLSTKSSGRLINSLYKLPACLPKFTFTRNKQWYMYIELQQAIVRNPFTGPSTPYNLPCVVHAVRHQYTMSLIRRSENRGTTTPRLQERQWRSYQTFQDHWGLNRYI